MPDRQQPNQPARMPIGDAHDVRAQIFLPALHRQRWSLGSHVVSGRSLLVQLSAGRGELRHLDGEWVMHASDIAWLPPGQAQQLQLEAGSAGISVAVSESLLAAVTGAHADGGLLRQVSARPLFVTSPDAGPREEMTRSLRSLAAEARQEAGTLRSLVAAHLTIVLVALLRLNSGRGATPGPSPVQPRLMQFRVLVEAQFRLHWPIRRYAAELGTSSDALHALCVRSLQRTPLQLLHQRLVKEACNLLAGTDISVERLAAELGFSSASHFNSFFKRWMGHAPQAWRQQARAAAAVGRPRAPLSYADWP